MKLFKLITLFSVLPFLLLLSVNVEASPATSLTDEVNSHLKQPDPSKSVEDINNEVKTYADSFSFENTLAKIQSLPIPMLVVLVIFSALLFLLSWLVPSLRVKAWSLIGLGILTYVLVMFPHYIVGGLMAIVDWFMNLFRE